MELSRITRFIIQRGAIVNVKVTGKHYRQSPLVQVSLEVPCQVSVKMSGSIMNHALLQRYEMLLQELYIEPKEENINGTFLSNPEVDDIIQPVQPAQPVQPLQEDKRKKKQTTTVKSKNTKQMFAAIEQQQQQQQQTNNTIVIE